MKITNRILAATLIPASLVLAGAGYATTASADGSDIDTDFDSPTYLTTEITGPIDVLPAYPDPNLPDADPDLSLVTFPAEVCVNAIPPADAEQGHTQTRIAISDFVMFDVQGKKVLPEVPDGSYPDQFPEKDTYGVGECASGTIDFIVDLSETDTNWISWKHRASNEDNAWEVPAQS